MIVTHHYAEDWPSRRPGGPMAGDHEYTLMFPLMDGTSLEVHCGNETIRKFREFLGSMDLDDMAEAKP